VFAGDDGMNEELAAVFRQVAGNMTRVADSPYIAAVARATDLLYDTFKSGGKLLVFGNGGSSADAQHLTAELVGRFAINRQPLAAIALTTNQAILTAWSNDYEFADVFARQIEALGMPNDVAMGISTSGTSPNVLNALRRARERGLKTIGLTGQSGGEIGPLCDVLLAPPVTSTARIQEVHLVTYHSICAALEQRLFGDIR
jgi:D-sedoheptulose 7-phosphate isomerase